ncbi:MAG TPA: hypothetical protein VM324_00280 [Egibacteraceae bacterium]|jgi:hypothetical protein|nr:hypothetical protein [Egibacteraceae bacterium]
MTTVRIEALPEQLQSRVLAATAHASHRRIRHLESDSGTEAAYAVEAVAGDRVTLMRLLLRPDESVDESTHSFTTREIVGVDRDASELTVRGPEGTRSVKVAPETAEAVRAIQD